MGDRINELLKERGKEGLLRELITVSHSERGKISVKGRQYVNLSSNDYLGLASHPAIRAAAADALGSVMGASASRLMTGSTELHAELEEKVAGFKGKPCALVFNSGYQANVGMISALCGKGDAIFSDRLNHASIIDGARLSGARLFRFRHNDPGHLEALLKRERNGFEGAMIVTETVFSMDGDIPPLEELVRLKKRYGCTLMVDEAHATGVFGRKGGGVVENEGLTADTDIIMGTFSKALGVFGAYAALSRPARDFLVNCCRSFIYSTSLPPALIAANIAALDIAEHSEERRSSLLRKAARFRGRLEQAGFTVKGDSQIVPVITGDNKSAVEFSGYLRGKGFWVTPVRPPTVPSGRSRIRLSLTYDHAEEDLDRLFEEMIFHGKGA